MIVRDPVRDPGYASLKLGESQAHVELLQQRQDECIVALGSLGCLPTELPERIRKMQDRLSKAESLIRNHLNGYPEHEPGPLEMWEFLDE